MVLHVLQLRHSILSPSLSSSRESLKHLWVMHHQQLCSRREPGFLEPRNLHKDFGHGRSKFGYLNVLIEVRDNHLIKEHIYVWWYDTYIGTTYRGNMYATHDM